MLQVILPRVLIPEVSFIFDEFGHKARDLCRHALAFSHPGIQATHPTLAPIARGAS